MTASLYQSGWSPRGTRKAWDRCSMDIPSTVRMLGHYAEMAGGQMVEAVGWFDDDGATRILIADFDNGRRIDVRLRAHDRTVTFTQTPEAGQ